MPSDPSLYRERTPWAPWVNWLLWGVCIVSAYPVLVGWRTHGSFPERALIAVGVLLLPAIVDVLLGGTTVLLGREGLRVFLGKVPLLSRRIAYDDVRSVESVRYNPIREFGGWGRRGFGAKQAWTARGDQAVVFHLLDGHDVYIGSDNPRVLEERIRTLSGGRVAARG